MVSTIGGIEDRIKKFLLKNRVEEYQIRFVSFPNEVALILPDNKSNKKYLVVSIFRQTPRLYFVYTSGKRHDVIMGYDKLETILGDWIPLFRTTIRANLSRISSTLDRILITIR